MNTIFALIFCNILCAATLYFQMLVFLSDFLSCAFVNIIIIVQKHIQSKCKTMKILKTVSLYKPIKFAYLVISKKTTNHIIFNILKSQAGFTLFLHDFIANTCEHLFLSCCKVAEGHLIQIVRHVRTHSVVTYFFAYTLCLTKSQLVSCIYFTHI